MSMRIMYNDENISVRCYPTIRSKKKKVEVNHETV